MQIYLLLTQKCNLSCPFCIRGKTRNLDLDIDAWNEILNKNDFLDYQLLLTGGEPSLYKNINKIIELSINKFKSISINTNGVDSKWIDLLKHNVHIQISLDGIKNKHNQLRNNGKDDIFLKIEQTIKKIENLGISYNISSTISQDNKNEIFEIHDYIKQFKGLKYWKISAQLPFGCNMPNKVLDIQTWNCLVNSILEYSKIKLSIKKIFDFELLDKFIKRYGDLLPQTNCGSGKNKFYIYPDFTVYPCTCLTDFPIGNLKKDTLKNISNSHKADFFSNYSVQKDSICHSCKYLKYCNGGCMGMSYYYFKELGVGDYRCPIIKEKLHIS